MLGLDTLFPVRLFSEKRSKRKTSSKAHKAEADVGGAVDGPRTMARVELAVTPREYLRGVGFLCLLISLRMLEHQYGRTVEQIADRFAIPSLKELIRRFLYHQLHSAEGLSGASVPLDRCPPFDNGLLSAYHSASATFYAPSDPCGTGGMRREIIRASPKWREGTARFDCVFVNQRNNAHGLLGMEVGRVRLFFRLQHEGRQYPCAVVHWFHRSGDEPDEDTGMWVVQPRFVGNPRKRSPLLSVIHLSTIVRAAHLIGVSIDKPVPEGLQSCDTLDYFPSFFVNKYIDHHAFELLHTSVLRA